MKKKTLSNKALEFLGRRHSNPKQKDFFDEKAEEWDNMSIHDLEKVKYITELLQIRPGDRILDVGTGTGIMIPHYLERLKTGHVLAMDYSEKMIAVARSKYPESDRLSYEVKDLYDVSPHYSFDIVVCYSCFPHFPDPLGAISVLVSTLPSGGRFCIAHSSSKEHINNVHTNGGEEICTDYLPEMPVMEEFFDKAGLDIEFQRDDDEYYIVIGRKRAG